MLGSANHKNEVAATALLFAFLALADFAIAPVNADTVPGFVAGDNRHLSFDPSPVTVLFRYSDSLRELRIPRKYIVIAAGDFSSRDGPIPDLIETHAVTLAIAYPDGEAWTVATRNHMREHGISARMVGAEMRYEFNKVYIQPSNINDEKNYYRNWVHGSENAEFDNSLELLSFVSGQSRINFIGGDSDNFRFANCLRTENINWLCDYYMQLSSRITVKSSFVDFRLHGGREFANQRMRFIRETVCTFTLEC